MQTTKYSLGIAGSVRTIAHSDGATIASAVQPFLYPNHAHQTNTDAWPWRPCPLGESLCLGPNAAERCLYDVAREFYKDINAAFIANYKKTTGKDIKIDQSHAGSSAQARAVNDGLDADVVTMNTTTDVDFLAGTGVVAKDWAKKFPTTQHPPAPPCCSWCAMATPRASRTGMTWSSPACR